LNWYFGIQDIQPLGLEILQPGSSQAQPYDSCRILDFLTARAYRAYGLTESAPIAATVGFQNQYDLPYSTAKDASGIAHAQHERLI
jgi:hypothetical protein